MARFLIADMQSAGHRARYVRWVIESGVMRRAEVILAGPKSLLEHLELVAVRGRFIPQEIAFDETTARVLAGTSFLELLRKQLAFRSLYMSALQQAKRSGAVDLVIMPAADDALEAWALLGTGFEATPWIGISMRPAFHLGSMSDRLDSQGSRSSDRLLWRLHHLGCVQPWRLSCSGLVASNCHVSRTAPRL